MFEDLKSGIEFAKKSYPGCSFSVREQPDGPTIISIRQRVQTLDGLKIVRVVVYAKKGKAENGGK